MMFNQCYQAIDWQAPWYQKLGLLAPRQVSDTRPLKDSVAKALNAQLPPELTNAFGKPLSFVGQSALPDGMAYESFIADTGQVPTRDNLHDLLGGLIWLNYPKTKAVFNQLHQQDIAQQGIGAARSRLRNVLTLFDENGGVVVSANPQILHALQNFDWHTALWHARDVWSDNCAFFPIGHALLEKLITPRPGICSHTLLVHADRDFFGLAPTVQRQQLDTWLSEFFIKHAAYLAPKGFQPLPVLGIPYFDPAQSVGFYQNTAVFRPKSARKPAAIWHF